jgi:hypothetical protein
VRDKKVLSSFKGGTMKRVCVSLIIVMILWFFSGCALFLVGAGVAGGIAISDDSAQFEKNMGMNHAWKVTTKIIEEMGTITSEDSNARVLDADVMGSQVSAMLTQISPKTVRVKISARKHLLPNVDTAAKILNNIKDNM